VATFWDSLREGLANLGRILVGEEPASPEESPEPGESFYGGGDDSEPPEQSFFGNDDGEYFSYHGDGPYPFHWDENDVAFWDTQFDGYVFENQEQYERLQQLFEDGYMKDEISSQDRVAAREDFLNESFIETIDWDAFREYHGYDDARA
jgi:hypothetical protein